MVVLKVVLHHTILVVPKAALRTILVVLALMAHTADLFHHTILVNLVHTVVRMVDLKAARRIILVNPAHMAVLMADLFHRTILVVLVHTVVLMADLSHRTILVNLARMVDLKAALHHNNILI